MPNLGFQMSDFGFFKEYHYMKFPKSKIAFTILNTNGEDFDW